MQFRHYFSSNSRINSLIIVMDASQQHRMKVAYAQYVQSLKEEHYLDDQFFRLVEFVDQDTPNFVVEIVNQSIDDSFNLINDLNRAMHRNPIDYNAITDIVHQLRGRSVNIGAKKIWRVCVSFRGYCRQQNYEGCSRLLQRMMQEVNSMRQKFDKLFEMEREFVAAGGTLSNLHRGVFT